MKKLILISLSLMLLCINLSAIKTAKSLFYSDSYMLRAHGVEAAYWNPANLIPSKYIDIWLPGLNSGVTISNNSLDLDTYNFVVGQDYLDDAEKQMILDKIDNSLCASSNGNFSVMGYATSNLSFSSSVSYFANASISERYLELLLFGNTDSLYVFDKSQNDLKAIGYTDFTFGAGNFNLPYLPENFPAVRAGFSTSILTGIGSANLEEFNGYLSSSLDGISLHQDLRVKTALGGFGFKGMLGLASNPIPHLELGITLDNLFGFMNWNLVTEETSLHIAADSVYAVDLEDDFYEETHETTDVESFFTELPPELRMAALWTVKQGSFSVDYVQGFKDSAVTCKTGRLSLGAQILPVTFLPLHFGLGLGNSKYPWRASYGIGLRSKTGELGVSVQSFKTFFPSSKSKGVSIGLYTRIWI